MNSRYKMTFPPKGLLELIKYILTKAFNFENKGSLIMIIICN